MVSCDPPSGLAGEFHVLCQQRDHVEGAELRRSRILPGMQLDLRQATASFVDDLLLWISPVSGGHEASYAIDYDQVGVLEFLVWGRKGKRGFHNFTICQGTARPRVFVIERATSKWYTP